jgi:hypothetical protein
VFSERRVGNFLYKRFERMIKLVERIFRSDITYKFGRHHDYSLRPEDGNSRDYRNRIILCTC